MIDYLRQVRLTWRQIGVIAALSGLATALVITSAFRDPSTPSALLAALQHRVVVHRHAAPGPAPVSSPDPSPAFTSGGGAPTGGSPSTGGGPTTPSPGGGSDSGLGGGAANLGDNGSGRRTHTPKPRAYKVKHVFVIALSAPGYSAVFGRASQAPYLNDTLRPKGTLLSGYETLSGAALPDYLAMISGQAPNPDTRHECASYVDFPASAKPGATGLMPGRGCVYPNTVLTVGDQVTATGAEWRAYIGDMGKSPCIHPNSGALDDGALPFAGAAYDTRHNPFIYFHSLLDLGDCATDDLSLTALPAALRSASKAPAYTFIAPDACADAASGPCPNGGPSGLAAQDAFLKAWVPTILASAAYRAGGALIITFAAPGATTTAASPSTTTTTTPTATTTATTTPTTTTSTPSTTTTPSVSTPPTRTPVRTGALVLSPFTTPGRTVSKRYNAYSVLRTTEALLGLKLLGHAAGVKAFIASALPRA